MKRARLPVDPVRFVTVYNRAKSLAEVARRFGLTKRQVIMRAQLIKQRIKRHPDEEVLQLFGHRPRTVDWDAVRAAALAARRRP